jgi:hypothetical protein
MASLGMGNDSFSFNALTIDKLITRTSPGNYALGEQKDGKFIVSYVGRADFDLNDRVKDHLQKRKYLHFKFVYAPSPKGAYDRECKNFHDFGGAEGKLDNKIHPDKPSGSSWRCPVCGQ